VQGVQFGTDIIHGNLISPEQGNAKH